MGGKTCSCSKNRGRLGLRERAQYIPRMLDLLHPRHWPSVCEVCAAWPTQVVCPACLQQYGRVLPRCPGCALPLAPGLTHCVRCTESPHNPLHRCTARVGYQFPWSGLVAQFKFQARPAWARWMAHSMAQTAEAQELLHQASLLAPIPLAPSRLRERGFNQAWELTKHLRPHTPAQALPDLLHRAETHRTQHTLPKAERLAHARSALRVNPSHTPALHQQHIVLVDDVMTTGATLQAAAHVLLQAGAASVSAMVFARTPPPEAQGSDDGTDVE